MKIINVVYAIASITLMVGIYFKFNNISSGSSLFFAGMFMGVTTSIVHYLLLQKEIKKLGKEQN